jgi:hypothetical protein
MLSEDGPNFDMTEAEFECVAQATVDGQANNLVMIDYDTDAGSSFGIMTDADIEICGAQADDDGDEDAAPEDDADGNGEIRQPTRVDTGAGGTATGSALGLTLLAAAAGGLLLAGAVRRKAMSS